MLQGGPKKGRLQFHLSTAILAMAAASGMIWLIFTPTFEQPIACDPLDKKELSVPYYGWPFFWTRRFPAGHTAKQVWYFEDSVQLQYEHYQIARYPVRNVNILFLYADLLIAAILVFAASYLFEIANRARFRRDSAGSSSGAVQ